MKKVALLSAICLFFILTPVALAQEIFSVTHEGAPISGPIFDFNDFKPGDCATETVVIENLTDSPINMSTKADNIAQEGSLGTELIVRMISGTSSVYEGTLNQFFLDTVTEGVSLGVVDASSIKQYDIEVCFNIDAGNEYQEESVSFDLKFGAIGKDHIVINEVYYDVDEKHGQDCSIDSQIEASIKGNASGSTNIIDVSFGNSCVLLQRNNANINNNISINTTTGGNNSSSNTGIFSIVTGNANVSVNIFNKFNFNFGLCKCNTCGRNDEWVEIYNPTDETVNLRRWSLTDNSGISRRLRGKLKPGQFMLISKSASTWRFWDEDETARKLSLGKQIGNGLENEGDHLILRNRNAEVVDTVGWGNDTRVWAGNQPEADEGSSIERLTPGFDTDIPSDWEERIPPTPGR